MEFNESVLYEVDEGVGIVTISSPETRNALTDEVKQGLFQVIDEVERNPEVKVVVITGTDKAFSAGGNIKGMGKRTVLQSIDIMTNTTNLLLRLSDLKKPIIMAVNGYAMGAGFSLVLAGDIIFADEEAKFGLSFTKVGLIPDAGLLYHLPRIVGPWKAKELIYDAKILSAMEAEQFGFVNKVFPTGTVLEETIQYAKQLASGPVQITRFVNSIIQNTINSDLRGTIEYENFAQSILQQTEDHEEGIQSFKEKRLPNFKGK